MRFKKYKDFTYRLLEKAGQYAKTDMVYLARGSFWLGVNNIGTTLFTLILAVGMANYLPQTVLGNYRYIISISVIVASFSLSGLSLAVIKDVARGVPGLLSAGFRVQLKWSTGMILASIAVGVYFFSKGNIELGLSSLIMGTLQPLLISTNNYKAFWEGRRDQKKLAIYSVITIVIYSTSLFISILFTQYVPLIVLVYFSSQLLPSYYFYRRSLRFDAEATGFERSTITLSKHFSFLNILSTLAAQLDKVLVFHFMGAQQLAIYAISQIPVAQIRGPLKQITQLAYPRFSHRSLKEVQTTIYYKMFLQTIPLGLIVLLYVIFAPFIFKLFFPKYLEALFYSQVSMASLLFFQKKIISYAVLAHGTKKDIYVMSVWASIYKILLLLILLPFFGLWGAIFAELIAQFTGLITSIFFMKKVVQNAIT